MKRTIEERDFFSKIISLRDGVNGDLVPFPVHLLHGRVVGVLVRDEEGRLDVATVRILSLPVEDLFVEADVVVVDGVIERDGDHLRHVLGGQVAGDRGAVLGAEAVGEHAHGRVAGRRPVRVVVHVCNYPSLPQSLSLSPWNIFRMYKNIEYINNKNLQSWNFDKYQTFHYSSSSSSSLTAYIFVGSVGAILLPVAEQSPLDAGTVAARQESVLAQGFLGIEEGFRLPLLVLQLAIIHRVLPIARLLVDVEVQPCRAPDRLQPRTRALDHVPAIVPLPCDQSEPLARILVLADLALEALLLLILLPLHATRALCNRVRMKNLSKMIFPRLRV